MIVIDVEIEKGILGRNDVAIEGIEYCNGWRDFENMGVSVACTYDTETHLSRAFFKEQLPELQAYCYGQKTAGFNTKGFDIPLLNAHGCVIDDSNHFDVLDRIWITLGRREYGWSLDNIMQATFGFGKSGSGSMAPVWWQQGKRGQVVDYCLRDVWLEAKLAQWCIDGNPITKGNDEILLVSLS
jgi:hypothetical protein